MSAYDITEFLRTAHQPFAYCVPSKFPLNTAYQKGVCHPHNDHYDENIKGCNYQIIMFDDHVYAFYMFLLYVCIYISFLKVFVVARYFCIIIVMVVCFNLNKFTFTFHFALCLSSTCSFVIQDFDWHLLSYIETLLMYSGI